MSDNEKSPAPAVSVVIPCYKQARYLPDALECLKRQTIQNWECIVVDDGSPDNTSQVVASFSEEDKRIRCVRQSHAGASAARNRGIQEASGSFIQFLDADDFIAPDKWEKQQALSVPTDGLVVSLSDYSYTDEDGCVLREHPCYRSPKLDADRPLHDLALRWEVELSVPIHCFLFDGRLFREHGVVFDQSLTHNEDWDCWMSVFALKPKVLLTDETLAFYRLHRDSRTRDKAAMFRSFLQAIRKQQLLHQDDAELQAILARKTKMTVDLYRPFLPPWSLWRRVRSTAGRLIRGRNRR